MKLLNNKRSQAVGILMSSLHLDMKDIQHGKERHTFFNDLDLFSGYLLANYLSRRGHSVMHSLAGCRVSSSRVGSLQHPRREARRNSEMGSELNVL